MYTYKAKIVRVIDGDTVVVDIDLGLKIKLCDQHIRLFGINAPERFTTEGKKTTAYLKERLREQDTIIRTQKKGKYGRWLGTIIVGDVNINEELIEQGLAERYI